jgi:hypothetical protein
MSIFSSPVCLLRRLVSHFQALFRTVLCFSAAVWHEDK